MTDDNPRLHRQLAGLASDWVSAKRRSLQRGRPNTVTDSGGSMGRYSWQGQELDRSELRKVKQMREKGGLVSWLFECKALMKFGTGAELQSQNDDLQEWLDENFERLDLLTLDLGSDGIWYPYGLGEVVETRGGEFSHIECIEPWTMLPRTNEYGEIVVWEQETQGMGNDVTPFQPEEIGSIVLNKSSGRDKVGVSEVLRSEEEITQYKENQRAVNKAIEIAGFPHHVWTVGQEGRSPVDDNDLRRVRNLIDNMDGDTQFVVGPDVDHDKITSADFDFEGVTKRDLRILTTTVGLPMELAGYGREGLGSGSETDLIGDMLALQNEVSRRRFETQFVEEFVRPVVRDYSPFSEDEPIDMVIKPFLDERENVADLIGKIGEYMSTAEVRDKLDLPPLEDDEMAESYRSPEAVEEAEEGGQETSDGGGLDSLFNSRRGDTDFSERRMQVPDNAVPINDPSEAPDGAQIVEGDRGGLYYVPSGEGPAESDTSGASTEELATGNPREEINTVDGATEYLEDFDEDDFEFDHWGNGPAFDKVSEGSVVEIWTGDMGFEEETALVIDSDGDEFTVVNADGVEKAMGPGVDSMNFDHTEEAALSDVWDDPANRADEATAPQVDIDDVEDTPTWFEERDFEAEYGAPEDVEITEGMPLEIGDEIQRVEESTTDNGIEYHRLDDGQIMGVVDGVLTKASDTSRLERGEEQYITWDENADMEDGWYAIGEDMTETDGGGLLVDLVDENGDTHEIDGVAVEQEGLIDRKHKPQKADVIEPELSGAHEKYNSSYPDSPTLNDNVSLDNISGDLDDSQRGQIERGLGKAQELGLTDNVSQVSAMDVEGEAAGMTLGRFEPETGEIKINTARMNQETLDSVGEGFAVGDQVEDMLVHESMHAAHAEQLQSEGWTPEDMRQELLRDGLPESEQEIMEAEVSEYGAANPLEVVAEIGTKITRGEEVSDEALHLYEKYGGPEL